MSTYSNHPSQPRPPRWRRALAATGGAAVAVLILGLAPSPAHAEGTIRSAGHPDAVPGAYIVALQDAELQKGVTTRASELAGRYGGKLGFVYDAALAGFSVRMDESAARRLAADPAVAYVEQDARVELHDTQPAPPSYGLDRIDQRNLPLDGAYEYPNPAQNVDIYILDTGVRLTHDDFGGRAFTGFDAVTPGGDATDCHGHGTHVAGTAAGTAYGVAKQARIFSVRVLGCTGSGTVSQVLAGVNWVTGNAVGPAVANMSLGAAGTFTSLNDAVANSITAGVTYVVSAGNDDADACGYSPAQVPAAITVGSTTRTDARSSFSNTGSCVDLFAPGSFIESAGHTSDSATATKSGTSMAAPHAAGAAAMVLSGNPGRTPAAVQGELVATATTGVVGNPGTGSPDRLLFAGPGSGPPTGVGLTCFSLASNVSCSVQYDADGPVTIIWLRDGAAVPAWTNRTSVSSTCNAQTTLRAVVSNAHGSDASPIWRDCQVGKLP